VGTDPAQVLQKLKAYAATHPEVIAFLTMSAHEAGAGAVYTYLQESGRAPGTVVHGTFDLSAPVVAAIEDGRTLFAIDAQPYVQGYLSVLYLTLASRQNIMPAAPVTPTGPGFVDQSNIALYKQLTGVYR
jgi:simple sugar transport system substrate-binding protein